MVDLRDATLRLRVGTALPLLLGLVANSTIIQGSFLVPVTSREGYDALQAVTEQAILPFICHRMGNARPLGFVFR